MATASLASFTTPSNPSLEIIERIEKIPAPLCTPLTRLAQPFTIQPAPFTPSWLWNVVFTSDFRLSTFRSLLLSLAPHEDYEQTGQYSVLLNHCEGLKEWLEACLGAREADVCHMMIRFSLD